MNTGPDLYGKPWGHLGPLDTTALAPPPRLPEWLCWLWSSSGPSSIARRGRRCSRLGLEPAARGPGNTAESTHSLIVVQGVVELGRLPSRTSQSCFPEANSCFPEARSCFLEANFCLGNQHFASGKRFFGRPDAKLCYGKRSSASGKQMLPPGSKTLPSGGNVLES